MNNKLYILNYIIEKKCEEKIQNYFCAVIFHPKILKNICLASYK